MSDVVKLTDKLIMREFSPTKKMYVFWCPACRNTHCINVGGDWKVNWEFNGNAERPTFTPSVKNTWDNQEENLHLCCHFNITDGRIIYHGDCTHELAGKTVDMEASQHLDYFDIR